MILNKILIIGLAGSNPAGGEILPEPKRRFIAQSLSCSPFHRLEMPEILLKGRKTLTHPSIIKGLAYFWIFLYLSTTISKHLYSGINGCAENVGWFFLYSNYKYGCGILANKYEYRS